MKSQGIKYTYRAEGSSYWSLASVFLGLVFIEGGLFVGGALFLIESPVVRYSVAAGLAAVMMGIPLRVLLAPLFTKHTLTDDELVLHYGRHKMVVPRKLIRSASPAHEQLQGAQALSAQIDEKHHGVIASFSERGQILLELTEPQTYRLSLAGEDVPVDRILFNVDDRDDLLRRLGTQVPVERKPEPIAAHAASPKSERVYVTSSSEPVPFSNANGFSIRTEGLTQAFGDFRAVDGLNLRVRKGEIYGFLGLNGAGKTTTMKMLVGLLEPTAGRAFVADHDVWSEPLQAKAAFGYVPDKAILYDRLSGREFLEFLAQVRGLDRRASGQRIEELLQLLELKRHAHVACGNYSFGMKRKLSLAGALLHQPSVLLLDEPFNGLDPRSAHRLKQLFGELSGATTIFLSTHDLATAEAVCHRVGILHHGRLIAEGRPDELHQRAAGSDLEAIFLDLTREEVDEVVA
ncbi:MAG TPA: ABC transporter ATP-binding protein [Thermoanaerobaculia bacterium]|nr:ABC transporter ATP-binding protein [Thermoanaerobaculia bacterium]